MGNVPQDTDAAALFERMARFDRSGKRSLRWTDVSKIAPRHFTARLVGITLC
jgi:hypothetical protein